jgi:hypothetical protein
MTNSISPNEHTAHFEASRSPGKWNEEENLILLSTLKYIFGEQSMSSMKQESQWASLVSNLNSQGVTRDQPQTYKKVSRMSPNKGLPFKKLLAKKNLPFPKTELHSTNADPYSKKRKALPEQENNHSAASSSSDTKKSQRLQVKQSHPPQDNEEDFEDLNNPRNNTPYTSLNSFAMQEKQAYKEENQEFYSNEGSIFFEDLLDLDKGTNRALGSSSARKEENNYDATEAAAYKEWLDLNIGSPVLGSFSAQEEQDCKVQNQEHYNSTKSTSSKKSSTNSTNNNLIFDPYILSRGASHSYQDKAESASSKEWGFSDISNNPSLCNLSPSNSQLLSTFFSAKETKLFNDLLNGKIDSIDFEELDNPTNERPDSISSSSSTSSTARIGRWSKEDEQQLISILKINFANDSFRSMVDEKRWPLLHEKLKEQGVSRTPLQVYKKVKSIAFEDLLETFGKLLKDKQAITIQNPVPNKATTDDSNEVDLMIYNFFDSNGTVFPDSSSSVQNSASVINPGETAPATKKHNFSARLDAFSKGISAGKQLCMDYLKENSSAPIPKIPIFDINKNIQNGLTFQSYLLGCNNIINNFNCLSEEQKKLCLSMNLIDIPKSSYPNLSSYTEGFDDAIKAHTQEVIDSHDKGIKYDESKTPRFDLNFILHLTPKEQSYFLSYNYFLYKYNVLINNIISN